MYIYSMCLHCNSGDELYFNILSLHKFFNVYLIVLDGYCINGDVTSSFTIFFNWLVYNYI